MNGLFLCDKRFHMSFDKDTVGDVRYHNTRWTINSSITPQQHRVVASYIDGGVGNGSSSAFRKLIAFFYPFRRGGLDSTYQIGSGVVVSCVTNRSILRNQNKNTTPLRSDPHAPKNHCNWTRQTAVEN